jgi:hypothetical protein|nr:MAG TPA: hypothetical protein [Caudoviricetes sp.]
MISQNDIEYLQDMVQRGEMSAADANVEMVLTARVKIIRGKLPKDVRITLNEAVKAGILAHMPRNKYLPECYYHPKFDYLARAERGKIAEETISAIKKIAK